MVFETNSPILAWLAVLFVQALIRFSLGERARSGKKNSVKKEQHQEEQDSCPLQREKIVQAWDVNESSEDSSFLSLEEASLRDDSFSTLNTSSYCDLDEDDYSLDGDEPRMFFELMCQTGSEMVKSRRSFECIVQEQILGSSAEFE